MNFAFINNLRNNGQGQPKWVTLVVIGALLGAIGFNLWQLFPGTTGGAVTGGDSLFHLLLTGSAVDAITHGRDITDPWQSMSLGFPVFHHYQHLPHVALALIHVVTFNVFPLIELMRWSTYLLLSLFPLSIFWSLRRFSFDPLTCAMGAVLASLIGNDFQLFGGFGYVNYGFDGVGLYTQLWGMILLPMALALGFRTMRTNQGYFLATLLLSATLMSHLLYGYMAFLTLGFLSFVPESQVSLNKSLVLGIWNHWKRLAVLFILVLSVTMYFLVPFLLDHEHFSASENRALLTLDSYGYQVILQTLVSGDLFDLGRFPSFSILIFAGIAICIFSLREVRYLVPLAIFSIWLLLFFGRSTWGSAMDLLPLSQDVYMHRFIGGVHLGGILLAAVALAVPWRWVVSRGNTLYIVGALVLTVLIVSPLYVERKTYLSDKAVETRENQRELNSEQEDLDEIIETLKELPPGRVYAGMTSPSPTPEGGDRWGEQYQIGSVTVANLLLAAGLDVLSTNLHDYSLSAVVEDFFDDSRPEQYNLFNIKYVVLPENSQVPNFFKPIKSIGRHQLYQVETTGYFDLVGSGLLFTGGKTAFHSAAYSWLTSGLPEAKLHPQVSIDGSPKHLDPRKRPSTVNWIPQKPATQSLESLIDLDSYVAMAHASPSRGSIVSEDVGTNHYSAVVSVERESILMLKTTYHPNWRIAVDGAEAESLMLMSGFMGVQLPPGEHEVRMEYRSRDLRKVLLALGFLSLVSIAIWEKRGSNIADWLKSWAVIDPLKGRRGNRSRRRRRTR
tara:strand:+ start:100 stop:2454 length:2355 start_codon:yes stop_codon:yes gene_type:complete